MTQINTEKKTALVTGANKGIGYEIAAGLAREGFSVGVGARDATRREEAVDQDRQAGVDQRQKPDRQVLGHSASPPGPSNSSSGCATTTMIRLFLSDSNIGNN